MTRDKTHYAAHYEAVMHAMDEHGLLLGSYDAAGRANLMTIGWGTIGKLWNQPVWTVLVCPSRYTCRCIEHSGCFSVNVPDGGMAMACAICGSRGGAEADVFAETGLTAEKGRSVLAPTVAECPIVYECRVIHSVDVQPAKLTDEILDGSYVDSQPHRMYFGKIIEVHAAADVSELLER